MNLLCRLCASLLAAWLSLHCGSLLAQEGTSSWQLPSGRDCSIEFFPAAEPLALTAAPSTEPSVVRKLCPTAIYLKNLQAPRVGTVADETLIKRMQGQGLQVAVFDFHEDASTHFPQIHVTLGKLRDALQSKQLLGNHNVDLARVYLVPQGCRLILDVEYARDGNRVMAMDIILPAESNRSFGTLIEFSCDNANRFGNGSLSICSDTLLDGLATQGFGVCMADHPVAPPYKGLDPMPECAERIRAAVRTLREQLNSLGANGKVVPVGFSRGSGMALLLTTDYLVDSESKVDGAVVLSGRFTYLDLLSSDKMIPRYEKAWGNRDTNYDVWQLHGALDHLQQKTSPLFLSINISESPEALHQMNVLKRRLESLGSDYEFILENKSRGHKVPLSPEILQQLARYLRRQLE